MVNRVGNMTSFLNRHVNGVRWAIAALAIACSVSPAFAQGCQMCYESAKGAPKDGQRALSRGILVLLVPPLSAMSLGVGAAFRYGSKRDRERDGENQPE